MTPTHPSPRSHPRRSLAPLVRRIYRGADAALRARVLAALLAPVGLLGRAAVAAGAFAVYAQRPGHSTPQVETADVERYSVEQIAELARFAEQVSPEALATVAGAVLDGPAGLTAFALLAALVLARRTGRAAQPAPSASAAR